MARKTLSKSSQRRVDGIIAAIKGIKTTVEKIDEKQITDLIRRAAIPISRDGYPTNSMPEHSSGGSVSDPTGRIAASKIEDKNPIDSVGKYAKQLEKEIKKAEKSLVDVVGILDNETRRLEKKKQRPTSIPCSICGINAAEKAGWCTPDYNDWWRHGSPDRLIWEMYSRKDVDETGKLRVPECPKPSPGRRAIRGPWK